MSSLRARVAVNRETGKSPSPASPRLCRCLPRFTSAEYEIKEQSQNAARARQRSPSAACPRMRAEMVARADVVAFPSADCGTVTLAQLIEAELQRRGVAEKAPVAGKPPAGAGYRLQEAGLTLRCPALGTVDGELVEVTAVLERTVVFQRPRDDDRHLARLEEIELVGEPLWVSLATDPRVVAAARGRKRAITITRARAWNGEAV